MRSLRLAFRTFRRQPGLTAVAVITLALGIGANTAVFSVVDAVLLKPLPYGQPDRLVELAEVAPDMPTSQIVDPFTLRDFEQRSRSIESVSMYGYVAGVLLDNGRAELIRGLRVNSNFFETLGVRMALGRNFLAEEDHPDRRFTVIILSYGLWARRFGADPHINGRVLRMSSGNYTVVGVLPPEFQPLLHGTTELLPEIYMPAGIDYSVPCRRCLAQHAVARLKPGVSVEQARAELNTLMSAIAREHPADYHAGIAVSVTSLGEFLLGRAAALWIVLGAAGLVLLIACANVANLLLARATGRAREMAVRAALGAGAWDLVRQLLAESLLLASAGGVAGLLLAIAGTGSLAASLPRQIPRVDDIHLNLQVLGFSTAATLLTALLCGCAPAWHAARIDLNETLRAFGNRRRAHSGPRSVLVIGQVALAFVLVTGAILLGRSFARLMHVNPGYDSSHLLTLSSNVWGQRYAEQRAMLDYYQRSLAAVQATPGILGAAWTSMLPLDASDRRRLHIAGRALASETEVPLVETYSVSPTYFRVMKIPVKRGRSFTAADTFTTPRVALISEACARAQFPNEDPIGKQIRLGDDERTKPWATIVGTVGDIRQYGLDRAPNMEVYFAQSQEVIIGYYRLVARTTGPPMGMEQPIRTAFQSTDPLLPVYHIKPLEDYLAGTLAPRTVTLAMLGMFSGLALLLASVGVYGVISFATAARTREVGIRMALGAERRNVLTMVLRQGLALLATGLAVGVAGSLVLTRLLASLLYEVRPADWICSAAAAAVLSVAAIVAIWLPARRAASIDPWGALRQE